MRISETGKPLPLRKRPPRRRQMYEKIRPIYIGRVKIRKLQPGIRSSTCEQSCTRSPVSVRIASGVDSRIEIGMDFIRRHVQQGDYPIFRSFPHEVSRQSSALLRISTKEPPRSPEARAGASCRKAISRR